MGLFSSKKKTIVGTSVSRLVKDELLPNSVLAGMTRGILQTTDIPGSILDELSQGLALKADSMYRYSENGYVFGSPSGDFVFSSRGTDELLAVLASIEAPGAAIELEYNYLGPPNILHIGWLKLVRDHGYNPATNKLGALTTAKGVDVFLDDLQVEIPIGSTASYSGIPLQQWGPPARSGPSPTRPAVTDENGLGALLGASPVLEVSIPAGDDCARAKYAWVEPISLTVQQDSFRVTNAEYDEAATFMQVKYAVAGVVKYWIYKLGTGTYPTLDALVSAPNSEGGNYFPFIHFRSKKASIDANTASPQYLHSLKMARKLGFDYVEMLDAINDNPDIGSIEQAFLGLMVPANTTHPLEQKYLFDYFNRMYEAGRGEDPEYAAKLDVAGRYGAVDLPYQFSEVIQDTHVKTVVVNSGIQKFSVASAGVVGTHTSGRMPAPAGAKYSAYNFYRRQISPNIYQEIRVLDLQTRYWVAEDYYAASDGDGENDILMVPLDRSITRTYGLNDRELLYSRSLHIVANSLVVQTIKWYQTGFFKAFLQIVAVVLFVWSLGSSSYVSAALAAGGSALAVVAAVVVSIIVETVTNMLIAYAFKLVAKELGTDLALLVAVAAAIYGGIEAFKSGGFSKSVTAQAALQTATGLVKGISATLMDAMKAIQLEMTTFQAKAEDKLKLLEEAQALLDSNQRLNPLVIFGESPESYYARTVHSGNIGTIGFTAVHNYVDMALQLPKISDTVEGY